ncbi:hypothetical protein SAMN05421788_101890 [Filimonas lacunae]|uniref:Lipoprotein n=1 Tax=Filimonas lacunae TaxID=477680 RepID=A0A173MP55_9BACT|nr:hypothetical protein [Filimonas lacunae]BAV09455.1 hypothetical protein FLA_5504 [Filimonas lacunae]SIS73461.1 hypothetical protein SAMN05421788_101890 [Filimonas lacunae]
MKQIAVLLLVVAFTTSCGNNNSNQVPSDSLPPGDHTIQQDTIGQGDTINRNKVMTDTIARKRAPMN